MPDVVAANAARLCEQPMRRFASSRVIMLRLVSHLTELSQLPWIGEVRDLLDRGSVAGEPS